jgi:hypothetical protein
MTPASMIFSTVFALMSAAPGAPTSAPELSVSLQPNAVHFSVSMRSESPFLGVVLASLRAETALVDLGLPPLLLDHAVLGFGASGDAGAFTLAVPEQLLPPGVPIYAQGVTYDLRAFRPTDVASFVLDASAQH